MKLILWLMLGAFTFCGCLLLREGVRSLVLIMRRRSELRRVRGVVMQVEKRRETRTDAENQIRTYVNFFPVIQFTPDGGTPISFRSEMGESVTLRRRWGGTYEEPKSRYSVGQPIEVLYDPADVLSPCLASWSGLFGPAILLLIAGLGFFAGAALVWVAFGSRLLGR